MDTPTKQRLVGAAVLVALAVIFLPMLVKGPAPDSGVSDVPLDMPRAPADDAMETRDLPLVAPQAGTSGALDAPQAEADRLPTVDTGTVGAGEAMQPAAVAAGDYAVHFGSYATAADADTLVRQLRAARLPGFREQTTLNGRTAWRVRIGPYATRAEAEAARLQATQVRDDVGARVVTLDAAPAAPVSSTTQAAAAPATATVRSEPLPPEPAKATTQPTPPPPTPTQPAPAKPAPAAAAATTPKPAPAQAAEVPKPAPQPAAAGTGFAVQVGAFGNAAEATRLRDRLRAAGFTAFTETVSSDKGPLTRVRVGPVLTRAEADRLRSQVSAKAGVSGMVRPHP